MRTIRMELRGRTLTVRYWRQTTQDGESVVCYYLDGIDGDTLTDDEDGLIGDAIVTDEERAELYRHG